MQHQLALYLGLLFYSVVMTVMLVVFNVAHITALGLLFGVPIVWWWHELYPPKSFLYSVIVVAVSTTILFESIAHTSGAWYSVGEGVFRLFGLIPIEAFFVTFMQFVYVVFLHEFFVDDKRLHHVVFNHHRRRLLLFLIMLSVIGILQATVFAQLLIPFALSVITLALVIVLIMAILLSHKNPRRIVEKTLVTVLLSMPLLLLYEAVSVFNTYTVYANAAEYWYSLSLLGELVPLEKFFQLTIMAFWIVVVYELYFDDAV